ncbi:unnamed protein product, partial [Mesorhabditis spiculigera]
MGRKISFMHLWYLDHISWNIDYQDYYKCDPHDFDGTDAQKRMVMGGEAAMWGEMVDATNVIQRIFPRTSAVAEKLWSSAKFTKADPATVWPRLQEMQCRMVRRGFPAQPGYGPGFCEVEYEPNLPDFDN